MITLRTDRLRKAFGGIVAVNDLSLAVPAGQVTTLLGPNGAGKTTLFNLISGFIMPDSGSITLGNRELRGLAPFQIARMGVGRYFQNVRLFQQLTVGENVSLGLQRGDDDSPLRALFASARDPGERRAAVLEHLRQVDLSDFVDRPASDLSYGQQKLLAFARLLATKADVLLLDEPMAGLSPRLLTRMIGVVRAAAEAGRTVLLIEHNLDAVKGISDRLVFLSQGTVICEGSVAEVLADPRLASAYLGTGSAERPVAP